MRTEEQYREMINRALEPQLRSLGQIPERLLDSMLYSLTAGGKRFRPVLLLASCEMAGGSVEQAIPFACALEMVHTYSLIHDDLPGMDNDDLRRGRPTNHRVYGVGTAILAGDGLLNAAMETALQASERMGDLRGIRASGILAKRAGVTGMIAGQTADLSLEGSKPTIEQVSYIHAHKTADLIQAPVEMGLILAGCEPECVEKGRRYGYHLGIAFQIVDDILDVTGDAAVMGKKTGMDVNKMTWVALRGVEGARKDAEDHVRQAVEELKDLPWDTGFLRTKALESLSRVK